MTTYEEIYELFFDRIINDKKFFIAGIPQEEFEEMAMKRAKSLLMESLVTLMNDGDLDLEVDFDDRDDLLEVFNFELTLVEKHILADLMLEQYIAKDLVTLTDLKTMYFTDQDLKMFSPNEAKKVFMQSLQEITERNHKRIYSYKKRGRTSHKFKVFNYGELR